ncbi:hypothetical protein RUND412_009336 [Rhizina undulata]
MKQEIENLQVSKKNPVDEEENLISFIEDPDLELFIQYIKAEDGWVLAKRKEAETPFETLDDCLRGIYKPVVPVEEKMLDAPVPPKFAGPSTANNNPAGPSIPDPPSQSNVEVPTEATPGMNPQYPVKTTKEKVIRMPVMLREGADVESMVSRILNEPLNGITVKDKVGSAKLRINLIFSVCHSVPLDVAGIKTSISVFVLANGSKDVILGRP